MTDGDKLPATQGATGEGPRDERGRFRKGYSGNPSGPKPGFRSLSDRLKLALEENDGYLAKWLLAAWVRMVFEGKVDAIKAVLDRTEGKVPQPIVGPDGGPFEFTLRIERANDNDDAP